MLCFVKSLPWLLNRNLLTEIKISFYRNIAILCAKMSRVNRAQEPFVETYMQIAETGLIISHQSKTEQKKKHFGHS